MHEVKRLVLGVCLLGAGLVGGLVQEPAFGQSGPLEVVSEPERQEMVEQTVNPFLHALQTGDAQTLEQLIGGNLAVTLGTLLKQNTEYPAFLRQRYGGTTVRDPIQIVQPSSVTSSGPATEDGQRIAVVHLQSPAGWQEDFQLRLERDTQGAWKVTDKKAQP